MADDAAKRAGSRKGLICAIFSGKLEEVTDGNTMHAWFNNQEGREAAHEGLRGVSEDGRHVGAPENVSGVRTRGLLRFIEEPARASAFSCDAASHYSLGGARGGLALVLYRRGVFVERRSPLQVMQYISRLNLWRAFLSS